MNKIYLRVSSIILLNFIACWANAQLIDNSSTFRHISRSSYFRFHYDNDYFTKSDEYYTQGITFEFVHPAIKRFPLSKLLWQPFKTEPQYGISLNLFGYTPTSILSDSILYGDRPFNAGISVKTFFVQVDEVKHQQISTALSVGVTGPAALGYEIQYNIHHWLKNPLQAAGTAILKPGQYCNCYTIGLHRGKYPALVQRMPVTVIRDADRNSVLDFSSHKTQTGLFGINIHHAAASGVSKTVDKYSAGCQVIASAADFALLMRFAERHLKLYGNVFSYTLIEEFAR